MSPATMTDRLPHERGFHVSWDQLHRDARALAWRMDGTEWRAVVAVTRGGLVPAMIVARELDIRTIDTISIRSYKGVGTEAGQGQLLIAVLAAVVLRHHQQQALGSELVADFLQNQGFLLLREHFGVHQVPAQLHPRLHLVHILPARPTSPAGLKSDFRQKVGGGRQHYFELGMKSEE